MATTGRIEHEHDRRRPVEHWPPVARAREADPGPGLLQVDHRRVRRVLRDEALDVATRREVRLVVEPRVERERARIDHHPMPRMQREFAASVESAGQAFAEAQGIRGDDAAAIAALRGLPLSAILPTLTSAKDWQEFAATVTPMIDGRIVEEHPFVAFAKHRQARVPLMIGNTNLESSLWTFGAEGQVGVMPLFPGDAERTVAASRYLAGAMKSAGAPVYFYRFSMVPTPLRTITTGAPHGTDVMYTFATVRKWRNVGSRMTATDQRDADTLVDYWAAFAGSGDPNGPRRPVWPQFDAQDAAMLEFTNPAPIARRSATPASTSAFDKEVSDEINSLRDTAK